MVCAKLRLPQLDEGIDLIAETYEGTFCAIQSKFRRECDGSLTRKELATFNSLAFVACTGISFAVVAHTLSKPIRKRHLMGNTVELGLERWLALDELHWSLIKSGLRGKPIPAKPRQPKQHQQEAVLAAWQHFSRESRGRLATVAAEETSDLVWTRSERRLIHQPRFARLGR